LTVLNLDINQGVATLTLNRPGVRNALNREMTLQLHDAIRQAAHDQSCRCLVITGAGEHFCAGRDLDEAGADIPPLEQTMANDDQWAEIFQMLRTLNIPSLAIVRGFAVAGGFTLAMGCDFVLAEQSARFGALEMKGGFCAAVNTAVLTHLLNPRQALELLLYDELIDADHLYRVGLITRLAANAAQLDEMADQFVNGLLRLEGESIRLTKDIHRATLAGGLEQGLSYGSHINSLMMSGGRFKRAAQRRQQRK